jgi:Fe-S-cluster containining protein
VWVSAREAEAIAAHLDIDLPRFTKLYTQGYTKVKGWWLLKNDPGSGEAQNCIFLREDNGCSIHAVRPIQCSTYRESTISQLQGLLGLARSSCQKTHAMTA